MTSDATARVRTVWERQARAWYDHRDAMFEDTRPIHEWLVSHVAPRAGQRLLEIAAGPGDTGFLAARQLGSGRLVSTDLSPAMVEFARTRAAELGITNVEHRVLDAQAMDLPDASFDGVICRWGLMLMPDPAAALRECRRVLVPGGRLAFAVFTPGEENPFAAIPGRVMVEMGHAPPPSGEWRPGILALGDRARLDALLAGEGFASTHVEKVNMTWRFADADDYWRFLVELSALGPSLLALADSAKAEVRAAIDARLAPFATEDGVALPSSCWCGVAVR